MIIAQKIANNLTIPWSICEKRFLYLPIRGLVFLDSQLRGFSGIRSATIWTERGGGGVDKDECMAVRIV